MAEGDLVEGDGAAVVAGAGVQVVADGASVRARTDVGEGWGECAALGDPRYSAEYVDGAADVLRRFFLPAVAAVADLDAYAVGRALAPFAGHWMAKAAIESGKVHCRGERCKPGKEPRVGDEFVLRTGFDERTVVVKALSVVRRGAPEAQTLYEETEESVRRREQAARPRRARDRAVRCRRRRSRRSSGPA